MRKGAEHAAALFFYGLAVVFFSYPLPWHLCTHSIGIVRGYPYPWNVWYFRFAIENGLNPFWTDLQHYPIGANLLTHTYTLGHGLFSYFLQPWLGPTGAVNLSFLFCAVLAGWGGFVLARYLRCSFLASWLSGFVLGFSPFATVLFDGGFDYGGYWPIPFFIWRFHRATQELTLKNCFLAAVFLTCSFFYAQFYFSFCLVFAAALTFFPYCRLGWQAWDASKAPWRRLRWILTAVFLGSLLWLAANLLSTGQIRRWEGRGSFFEILKYVLPYWCFFGSGLALFFVWQGRWIRFGIASASFGWRAILPLLGTIFLYGLLNAPMIGASLSLAASGLDIDAPSRWRGGGTPTELLRYLMPNLEHPLLAPIKPLIQPHLDVLGLSSSMGWVLPFFLILYFRRHKLPQAHLWLACGFLSWILSLGPYLMVAGFHTYIPLPFWLIRQIPLIGSPIQAVSYLNYVNYLFFGLAGAMALDDLRRKAMPSTAAWKVVCAAYALILFESLIALPRNLYAVPVPKIYERFRAAPEGGVLALPFGVSLRYAGTPFKRFLESRHLLYQMTHRHPVLGGFITRSPRSTFEAFVRDPFLTALDNAQEGSLPLSKFLTDTDLARRCLRNWQVRYVTVEKNGLPPDLMKAVLTRWPLRKWGEEGAVMIYSVY